jgi:hypothetical protein
MKLKILNKKEKRKKSVCWKLWTYSFGIKFGYWCFCLGLSQCPCSFSKLVCWAVWQWMLLLFVRQHRGELAWGIEPCVSLVLWAGVQARSLKWSQQKAGLWAVIGPFCPWGRLLLSSVITHFHLLQGGQICFCLHQAAAELLQSHFCSG